jgi:hypothetical protein
MTIYTNAAATALRLLTKYGQTVTLRKLGPAEYDPTTSTMTPTTTDYSVKGAVLDYARINFGETLQNGTLVQGADRRLILASNVVRPSLNDHVFLTGGNEWVILEVKPVDPSSSSPVMYDCRIRQ